MSNRILPDPDTPDGTDTPTPADVYAALAAVNAEQITPGVWIVHLSNGVILRLTAPTSSASPTTAEVPGEH